ncbi:MAG: hypothetical protein JST84_08205 [Acidobacteria bacterium]|nr:hypothetical protein [Acidobacteriota bacterium]
MHLSFYQLNRYRHARLEPAELLSLDDHLTECEFCRQQLRAQLNPQSAFFQLRANLQLMPEPEHLSSSQYPAFVNNTLSTVEQELVVSHLEYCDLCAGQMRVYRAAMLESRPTLGQSWLAIWETWRERLALVWPMPVAAAVVIALVALVDGYYFRAKPNSLVAENAPLPVTPTIAAPIASASVRPESTRMPKVSPTEPVQIAQLRFPAELAALRGGKITRGSSSTDETFQLTRPIATFVLSPRPTLRWQSFPSATIYRVKVFSTDYELIAESADLTATSWTLPVPLERGKTYLWQVVAKKGEEEFVGTSSVVEARFTVLDSARARQIEQVRQHTTSPLALGIAYAQAGLLDDAEAKLKAALPSAAARKFLHQVQAAHGK